MHDTYMKAHKRSDESPFIDCIYSIFIRFAQLHRPVPSAERARLLGLQGTETSMLNFHHLV